MKHHECAQSDTGRAAGEPLAGSSRRPSVPLQQSEFPANGGSEQTSGTGEEAAHRPRGKT
jgi:hypothetical protein